MENSLRCNDQISDFTFFKKIEFKNLIKFRYFKKLTSVFLLIFSLSAAIAQEKKPNTIDQTGYFGSGKTAMAVSTNQNNLLSDLSVNSLAGKTEDLSKRDAFSKHYKNNDGSYTARISSVPVNYQKDGKWNDINTNITIDKTAKNFSYSNKTNLMETSFGSSSEQGVVISAKEGAIKDFLNTKMYWEAKGQKLSEQTSKNVAPTVKGSQLFYNNLFGNISAEFTIFTGERKLNYIIPDKEALGPIPAGVDYLVFSEEVILPKGWTYEIGAKKDILLKDETGEVIYRYVQPQVLENYTKDGGVLEKDNVASFEIEKTENGFSIKTKVKAAWLLDAKRVFPLAVDPTVRVYPNVANFWSGWVDGYGNGGNTFVQVGYTNNPPILGFVKFNTTAVPNGATVTGVQSGLYLSGTYGNTSVTKRIYIKNSSDPVNSNNSQIYNSSNRDLSFTASVVFNGYTVNTFTQAGIDYVQNNLANGFSAITVAPDTGWYVNNYFQFYGYNYDVAPYLDITYSTVPSCTTPSSPSTSNYINNVKFLGTLNPDTVQPSIFTSGGYANYKTLANKAKQIPTGGINVYVSSGNGTSYIKAWIDWDNNGVYDETAEKVYSSAAAVSSTTFGFIVPSGRLPGMYNIRIRNYSAIGFSPCGSLSNGETEDYSFEVIEDCTAKITKAPQVNKCGSGAVTLSATKSTSVSGSGFKWYSSEFGGTALSSANTYTPDLSVGTYTYYVTATIPNGCESVKRTPIKVVVSPIPTITFSQSTPSICGDISSLIVTSSGDKEEATIFEENFETGLGAFSPSSSMENNGPDINGRTQWQSKSSTYVPTESVWFPAINSGSNKFAYATSDISNSYKVNTTLTYNSTTLNTTNFQNLYLSFDAYFSYYGSTVSNATEAFYVEVSTNGTTWVTPKTYQEDIGIGTRFDNKTIDLSAYINQPNLRLRFRYQAGWNDGVAIDNVRLYGDRPLPANFTWAATNGLILKASDCSSAVPSGGSASICIKPSLADIESKESWTVTSTATLNNGCSVSGPPIIIKNDNRIWNNVSGSTDWNATTWQPNTAVPDINKCVIIKQPVVLNAGAEGFAKNVTVETGGKLTITKNQSLTVSDGINNKAGAINFVVENDANLLQINDAAVNTGDITVKRNSKMVRLNYIYWGVPVTDQKLGAFSPATVASRFYSYNEKDDSFSIISPLTQAMVPGKGYVIRAPNNFVGYPAAGQDFSGIFKGGINNGVISPTVTKIGAGKNLLGNPYPSNIILNQLTSDNPGVAAGVYYFWTNFNDFVNDTNIPGSGAYGNYTNNHYATWTSGSGGAAGANGSVAPTGTIKPGQGFLLVASNPGTVKFKNSIRTKKNNDSPFYSNKKETGKLAAEAEKFRLKLTTPIGNFNTLLLAYVEGATNNFEPMFDAEFPVASSDQFYSISDGANLIIQGRQYPFIEDDIVRLGMAYFIAGDYTISLSEKEGIFENGQNIYLKDKQTGIVTNLSEGDYMFTANEGVSNTRFEIIYKPEIVLGTDSNVKEGVIVYRDSDVFVIKSPKTIKKVEVYDLSGRLIALLKPDSKEGILEASKITKGIYVLKITATDGEITNKKISK